MHEQEGKEMSQEQDTTDWKAIAMALAQRVNFAVTNCSAKGGLFNTETGEITPWRDYMAEGMEMIPGLKVDRDMLGTMDLPPTKRRKAQAEIKAKRLAEKADAK